MRLALTEQPGIANWNAHPISRQDGPLLGKLTYDAYYGTIDYEGETLEETLQEIEATLTGKYGPLLANSSFFVAEHGRVLGASMVTDWTDERSGQKQPLLSFLMTDPAARGRGLATALLKKSINALLTQGEKELVLFVTVGNDAAQHIYQKLGFQVEEEFEINRIKKE